MLLRCLYKKHTNKFCEMCLSKASYSTQKLLRDNKKLYVSFYHLSLLYF